MMHTILMQKPMRFAALCVTVLLLAALAVPSAHGADASEGVLRLHILANSDSAEDQRVKLAVRDAVLQTLPACDSAAEAEAYLRLHGGEILELTERTLRENGFDYGAQLLLGKSDFPDRAYAGTVYPAGEYEALRIVLGAGGGQNWWCVLFPPLCIITAEQEPLPEPDALEFESSILSWIRSWEPEA